MLRVLRTAGFALVFLIGGITLLAFAFTPIGAVGWVLIVVALAAFFARPDRARPGSRHE